MGEGDALYCPLLSFGRKPPSLFDLPIFRVWTGFEIGIRGPLSPGQLRGQVGGEEPTPSLLPCLLPPQRDAAEAAQPHPGV